MSLGRGLVRGVGRGGHGVVRIRAVIVIVAILYVCERFVRMR